MIVILWMSWMSIRLDKKKTNPPRKTQKNIKLKTTEYQNFN